MDWTFVFFGRDNSGGCFYAVEDGEEIWRICEGDDVTLRKGAVEIPAHVDRITFAEGIRLVSPSDGSEEPVRQPIKLEAGVTLDLQPASSGEWVPCLVIQMRDEFYVRPLQPAAAGLM